jgi:PleD family two-component response regulator
VAAAKARDIERLIEEASIPYGPERLSVGASAGVTPLRPGLDPAQVLDAADKAMYARKTERKAERQLPLAAQGGRR